jgi:radical SAM superfamily enzyme YgiQ (UPF0313 family)
MKILLVNPPLHLSTGALAQVARQLFYNSPPLGLAYLAAVLEQDDHRVKICDCPVSGIDMPALAKVAEHFSPDIIGISSTTLHFTLAIEAAKVLRKSMPQAVIGYGGPHATANPELLADEPTLDFLVVGEGEITLREIVRAISDGQSFDQVPGVVTRQDGEIHFAPPRPLIEDLDTLPRPARHLLPLHRYLPLPNDQLLLPKTSAISSRGCPFACTFCDKHIFGARYRSHSPKRIVTEMHELGREHKIRDIAFVDSTFTPNRKRVLDVLSAMEADPAPQTWTCSARADVVDEEILRRMKAAKCWRIRIGVESGNDEILGQISKGITKAQAINAARTADRIGLAVKAFFMVGHVGETHRSLADSLDLALKLPLTDLTVQINTPLRGTKQYDQVKGNSKHGRLLTEETTRYSFFEPVFIPKGLSAHDLLNAQRRMYRRFYLRPRTLFRHLLSIRRLSDIAKYIRALPLVFGLLAPAFKPKSLQ